MRALITGAGGFVGRHLARHLEAEGDEVCRLDRQGSGGVDVTDPQALRATFADARPEAVYHLAALTHVGASWDDPGRVLRVNAEGTLNVLRASAEVGARRILVVGSAEEYGRVAEADLPLREDAPLRPLTPYGASKVAASFLALQAFLADGLGVVRVRAFNHAGPGQSESFLIAALACRIVAAERRGDEEIRVGSLDAVRDLLDVRDVVVAYRLLVEHGEAGEVYNVCSGRGRRVAEVAEALVALARHPLRLTVDPALLRPVEVPRLVGDPARLRARTGFEPRWRLEDTLADVMADWRARAG
ncbi:MAG: GDP-mannose 4,6-dehydratase [Acidimicrobiia bacterium]